MRRAIRIGNVIGSPNAFELWFIDEDAARAQAVTADLSARFVEQEPGLQLLHRATVPEGAVGPNRFVIAGLGLAGGLIVGTLIARIRGFLSART